jgi:long-chain acyl-CoA synthetase
VLRNDLPFFEVSLAARMLGANPVPVNWHFTADEAGYILRDSGAKAVVIHSDLLETIRPGIPDETFVLGVSTPDEIAETFGVEESARRLPDDVADFETWVSSFEPLPPREIPPPVSMVYTSGTTGRPKGVRRFPPTPEQDALGRSTVQTVLGMSGPVVTVICGPMYHAAPNGYGLMAAIIGGEVILQPRFDPEGLLALIEAHAVSHLFMVPIMFVRLLHLPEEVRSRYDVSSLRWVVHGGAPCPPDVKRQMIDWWGPVVYEFYGSTEVGIVALCDSQQWLAHPGTVGRVVEGASVRVLDEAGRDLAHGEAGEVHCRFDGMSDFTYQGDEEKRRAIEREGLIATGDIGFLDAEGFVYLCDRKADLVISGGVNIYPAEIEAELMKHAAVADCAIFGIPDSEFGERLCAVVQPKPGATLAAEQLQDFLRKSLAGYKIPRIFEFRQELPRDDSGKIFKRSLRDPYWGQSGRRI